MLLDALAVIAGYGAAQIFYRRDTAPSLYWEHLTAFLAVALVFHLTANRLFGLYGRIWRHAGIEEARQLLFSAGTVLVGLLILWPHWFGFRLERVPIAVVVVGAVLATVGMGGVRFHSRLFAWQRSTPSAGLRVAVIGSRDAGAASIREMLRSPGAGLVPVAVFDDDHHAHGRSLMGVPVVGTIEDIPAAAPRYLVQQVLLAIPNPPPGVVDRALAACETAGVSMKVLPSVRDIVAERPRTVTVRRARDPRIEDLLGRSAVQTDLATVRQSLEGQRVLITGAGGSIGSEIARQVASFKPAELVLLDRDETHLYDTAATTSVHCEQILADVTDSDAIFEVFLRQRPDVVFHAAAHKHVPMLEHHPVEAARVNVFGTLNTVHAAAAVGTQRFVMISTDKAVRPVSVMGASKRLGELLVMAMCPEGAAYCSVRFGNVLGSRGSVIPTFTRQIAEGGPVTVTDPRMTRYFMSVEESVQLVLQASVLSEGSETFVLEMGQPVRIIDLAERMIRLSGYEVGTEIPIRIVGRRAGEKLHEDLREADENLSGTAHPSVKCLTSSEMTASTVQEVLQCLGSLQEATSRRDGTLVRHLLFEMTQSAAAVAGSEGSVSHNGLGTISTNGRAANGHARNGHAMNGSTNGATNGHGTNGHAVAAEALDGPQ